MRPCLFKAITINSDFGCMEWPGGAGLCPDAMHQAITGSASEVGLHSAGALREDVVKSAEQAAVLVFAY